MGMRDLRFGVEIEMTGLTREKAVRTIAEYFQTDRFTIGSGDNKVISDDGRIWRIKNDGSIIAYRGSSRTTDSRYRVEFVTPICTYEDIKTIQEIVRALKNNGARSNESCGVHIHVDASGFTAKKLRNLNNIMYSKEDLLFKTLKVLPARKSNYCEAIDPRFLERINRDHTLTMEKIMEIYRSLNVGRYRALNLQAIEKHHTVEFRLFNGTLHAGEIKAYIHLCLAICNQALTQTRASRVKTVSENEAYTFRTWLLRLGLIGEEFKSTRKHLLKNLDGNVAWKDPSKAYQRRTTVSNCPTNKIYYAAYGTEMNNEVMMRLCPHAEKVGMSCLVGYQLLFRTIPTLEEAVGKVAWIGVYLIPENELQALDRFNHHDTKFVREHIPITVNGITTDAVYYKPNFIGNLTFPEVDDFRKILAAYQDFNIESEELFRAVEASSRMISQTVQEQRMI